MTFNALDYLLMLILLLGAAWGMVRGAGKLLIGLFSLYVGLVASLLLYRPLGNFFRQLLPAMSVTGSEALAFDFLLLVLVNGFNLLTRYFATPPEESKKGSRGAVKEVGMLKGIMDFYRRTQTALESKMPLERITSLPVINDIARMREIEAEDSEREIKSIMDRVQYSFADLVE